MSYVSRPDLFEQVLKQTIHNVELISEGVMEQTTGKELSTARDTELKGAEYIGWFQDLAGRGILAIVANFDELYGSNWVEKWSEQYDREVEKLGLV
jgi:hypothetical protein